MRNMMTKIKIADTLFFSPSSSSPSSTSSSSSKHNHSNSLNCALRIWITTHLETKIACHQLKCFAKEHENMTTN